MKKGDIVRVKTNAELLNYLFNKDYKQWMKTTYEYNDHIVWMVHFDGEKRDGWKNHLGEKLIIEENTDRLVKPPETYLLNRIVFSKHNGYFIFEGIFKYDNVRSIPTSIRYYNLLSETFLEETRPSPNKNINLPFDRTYYYVSDKNIKVVLTNKYHVDEFFQLFANNKIKTEIPRMPINTNAKLYTNRTHYCTSHSPTFKPIIAELTLSPIKKVSFLIFRCEHCGALFVEKNYLRKEILEECLTLLQPSNKFSIPKEQAYHKPTREYPHKDKDSGPITFYQILQKWAIEHPFGGGSCSHK